MKNCSMEQRVGELLINFGIAPSLKGFQYIIDAVCLWDGEKTGEVIYMEIAKKRECRADSVERAIRNAFRKLDFDNPEIRAYFGNIKRMNVELISLIAWKLSMEAEV